MGAAPCFETPRFARLLSMRPSESGPHLMPRLLILLTLPPEVTEQYRARLSQKFPEIAIDVVSDKSKAEAAIKAADMLLTFGQMLKNLQFDLKDAGNLKWIQALGTGMDGITDQP